MSDLTAEEVALAQPDQPETATIEAWFMDDSNLDQRAPHRQTPNKPVIAQKLAELGVLYWKLDADNHENDPKLAAIRKVRGYSYVEIITITKDTLPNYEEKIKTFYQEHMHTDEEIRYILDGAGYFDVRDFDDQWIRILCKKGDLVILPEGIYHRFTLDEGNKATVRVAQRALWCGDPSLICGANPYRTQVYASDPAMRLFVGAPIWTPYNRPQDEHPSVQKYKTTFHQTAVAQTA